MNNKMSNFKKKWILCPWPIRVYERTDFMKRIFGHTKKPSAYWEENRRGGYDWEDEDFSYEEMGDGDYEDSVDEEPEQAPAEYSVESAGESEEAGSEEYPEESGYDDGEYQENVESNDGIEYPEEPEESAEEYAEETGYDEDGEYEEESEYGSGEYLEDKDSDDGIEYLEEPEESAGEYAEETGYDEDGEYEEEYESGEYLEDKDSDDGIEYLEEPEEIVGEYAEETGYDEDGEYEEESEYESGEYLEDKDSDDGIEYLEEPEESAGEYAEETGYDEDGEYEEEIGYGDDVEALDGTGYEEEYEGRNSSDIQYIEDETENTEEEEIYRELERRKEREKERNRRKRASVIDGAIAFSGVAVVLLAVVVGIFLFRSGSQGNKEPDFLSVGNQIQGIELIGGKGIAAVANAEMQKIADANNADINADDLDSDYDESDLTTTVAVVMTLTSVKNDLKIKFCNRESSKLIGNVRFVAEVTKPDGTVEDWTDSDLDGIIYEKNITAGKYSIALKTLEEEKYSNLVLPATAQTVTVKSNIEYKKVDVTGEGKKESEINANEEDTKKNETSEESSLTDTVAWVPSTSTGNTYVEVLKSAIPDPLTQPIQVAKAFRRVTNEVNPSPSTDPNTESTPDPNTTTSPDPGTDPSTESSQSPSTESSQSPSTESSTEPTTEPSTEPTTEPSTEPTTEPSTEPTTEPSTTPTTEPSTEPTTEPSTTPSTEPSVSPEVKLTLSLDAEQKNLQVMKAGDGSVTAEKASVKAVVQTEGAQAENIAISCSTANGNVATAVASETQNGEAVINITAVGVGETKITVTASYQPETGAEVKASKDISVKVTEKPALTMSLDKTELLAYSEDKPLEVTVTVSNSMLKAEDLGNNVNLTAQTSDSAVAVVTKKEFAMGANGSFTVKLTLTPQVLTEKKSCTLNVSYQEGGETVSAKCAVTIKPHPKNDRTTKLLDNGGRTLYVMENNAYREAVYADYYSDVKFFVQSGVKYTGWQTLDGKVYYYTAEGQYVTGEQVIQGAKYNFGPDGVLMSGNGVLGIDVSKWNGTIDWKAVKNSGVTFVIIRCGYRGSSQGMLVEDPKFTANIKGATDAGLKVGVYFFTQAVDEVEAVYEASYVLEKVKNYKLSYPIFLDVEASGGRGDKISKETRTQVCKAFCQTIQNAGYTAGVYANKNWFTEKINASELGAYRIWLAQYASTPTYTGRYDMWQYKSTGSINGISGDVDMNLSYMGY